MAQPVNQFLNPTTNIPLNPVQQLPIMPPNPTSLLGRKLIIAMHADDHPLIQQILSNPAIHQIPPTDLGLALILSIQRFQEQYCDDILQLPNANNIPANGYEGIGHAFLLACQLQDPDILMNILQHPMFLNIAANAPFGLGEALSGHIRTLIQERQSGSPDDPNPAYLQAILGHPQVNQIHYNGQMSPPPIGGLLFIIAQQSKTCFNKCDQDLVVALLNPTLAHLIPHNGPFGLGRILAHAVFSSAFVMVNSILNLPYRFNPIGIVSPNFIEQHFQLEQIGLKEILYLAVNNFLSANYVFYFMAEEKCTESFVQTISQDQEQIVQLLINHLIINTIYLKANGSFSLADSLTSAATINENLVPIILTAPSSQQIVATAGPFGGGLDEALCNAADEGHLLATQQILQHPNAPQIQIAQLREAHNAALHSASIMQAIQDFTQAKHRVTL